MDFPGPGVLLLVVSCLRCWERTLRPLQGQPGFLNAKLSLQALIDIFC